MSIPSLPFRWGSLLTAVVLCWTSSVRGASEDLLDFWDDALANVRIGTEKAGTQQLAFRYDQVKVGAFSIQPLRPGAIRVDTDPWGIPLKAAPLSRIEFWLKPAGSGKPPGEVPAEISLAQDRKLNVAAKPVETSDGWSLYRAELGNPEPLDVGAVVLGRGTEDILLDGLVFRSDGAVTGVTDKPLDQWVGGAAATRANRTRAAIEAGTGSDFSGEMRQIFDRLWIGRDVAPSNARLRELFQENLDFMKAGAQDLWSLSMNVRLFQFYYELGSRSGRNPPPLEPATEKLLLELIWKRTEHKNDIGWASSSTWWLTGSENHDLNAKVSNLISSRIFMDEPAYKDRLYPDEANGPGYGYWFHTMYGDSRALGPLTAAPWKPSGRFNAAAHYKAWVGFFEKYLSERAKRGFFLEQAAPGYQKWTMGFLIALRRYCGDDQLKDMVTSFFDLVWADWAEMQIGGVRGGPKTRHSHQLGGYDSMTDMSRFYLGGQGSTFHILSMMVLDDYAFPPVVFDLALDTRGRGTYAAVSRGIGEEEPVRPRPEGMERTLMTDTESRFLKYAWVTPQYILGTQMDHPDAVHSHLSAAGRWHGLIIAGEPDLRIVPNGGPEEDAPKDGAIAMDLMYLTAQDKNVLVGQQARHWNQISPSWFPSRDRSGQPLFLHVGKGWDEKLSENGWLFLRKGDAYAAVRGVAGKHAGTGSGALNLKADLPLGDSGFLVQIDSQAPVWNEAGDAIALPDPYTPFIIHAGSRAEHGDFAKFRATVLGSRLELRKTVVPGFHTLVYQGAEPGSKEIDFPAASPDIPRIGGRPVEYRPARLYDSPFHQSDYGTGRHTIRKDGRELVVDLAGPPAAARKSSGK